MAKKITIGLASIKLGAIATDGDMGTNLTTLGDTSIGTCKLNFEDPEKTEFFVEEFDDPIYVAYKQGAVNIVFEVANPDLDAVVRVFGGTIEGTGKNRIYKAPNQYVSVEQSLEVMPRQGLGFKFPRVSLSAKFTSDLSKDNIFGLEVTANVLKPTKEGVSRFTMVEV